MAQSVLESTVDRERERLESIAQLTDPATIRTLRHSVWLTGGAAPK